MVSTFLTLSLLRGCKILLSVGSILVFARIVGANQVMDSWVLALSLSSGVGMIMWGALNETLRTRYIQLCTDANVTKKRTYIKNLLFFGGTINVLVGLLIILACVTHYLLFNDLNSAFFNDLLLVTIALAPTLAINQFTAMTTCIMNCEGKIYSIEVSGAFGAILNIFLITVLFENYGIWSLVTGFYAFVLSSFFYSIYWISSTHRCILNTDIKIHFHYFKPFLHIAGLLVISYCVGQVTVIIERALAVNLGEGVVSIVNYAMQIKNSLQAVIATVLLSLVVPILTRAKSKNMKEKFLSSIKQSESIVIMILLLVIPILSGSSRAISELIFSKSYSYSENIQHFEHLLIFYSLSLLPVIYYVFYGYVLVSSDQIRTYAFVGIVCQLFSLLVTVSLIQFIGVYVFPTSLFMSHLLVSVFMIKYSELQTFVFLLRMITRSASILLTSLAVFYFKQSFLLVINENPYLDILASVIMSILFILIFNLVFPSYRVVSFSKKLA